MHETPGPDFPWELERPNNDLIKADVAYGGFAFLGAVSSWIAFILFADPDGIVMFFFGLSFIFVLVPIVYVVAVIFAFRGRTDLALISLSALTPIAVELVVSTGDLMTDFVPKLLVAIHGATSLLLFIRWLAIRNH